MKCTNCNNEIDDNAKFCGYCGLKIAPKKKSPLWIFILLVLIVMGSFIKDKPLNTSNGVIIGIMVIIIIMAIITRKLNT